MEAMETERAAKQINWHQYNYPPLLKLMHFRPSQLPEDRKMLVSSLFVIHITAIINTILAIVTNCIIGGLGILYAFLWFFIFNPIVLFLFYRGYIGICKQKSQLNLYLIIQPIIIVVEIVIAIIFFIGFTGFIAVSQLFHAGNTAGGIFATVVSILYLLMALFSGYIYFRIFRQRSILTKALL